MDWHAWEWRSLAGYTVLWARPPLDSGDGPVGTVAILQVVLKGAVKDADAMTMAVVHEPWDEEEPVGLYCLVEE